MSPAVLLHAFSLLAEYCMLFLAMIHMDKYQYYVGRGTAPIFVRKPPIRLARSCTTATSPAVNYWTRMVAIITLLRQRVHTGWWTPQAVVDECFHLMRLAG